MHGHAELKLVPSGAGVLQVPDRAHVMAWHLPVNAGLNGGGLSSSCSMQCINLDLRGVMAEFIGGVVVGAVGFLTSPVQAAPVVGVLWLLLPGSTSFAPPALVVASLVAWKL